MDINNQIPEGYVSTDEAMRILDTSPNFLRYLCDDFEIKKVKMVNKAQYYCLDDINRVVKFVDEFFQNHYPYKDIVSKYTESALESQGIFYIETPCNYGRILRSKYPKLRTRRFYKKYDIRRFEKIMLDEFIDRNKTLDILKIPSRRFILNPLVEGFNIKTMQKENSTIYNKEDVESALNEVLLFSQTHYLIDDVLSKGIETTLLEDNNIYPVDVPVYYQEILKNIYRFKTIAQVKVMYEKHIIDDFIKNPNNTDIKNILNSIKKGEPIKKGYFNILFENKMCVDSKRAVELLEFEASYSKNIRYLNSLCENGDIRIVMPKGTPYYYVPDIKDVKNKREKYFKIYVPRAVSNERYCNEYGTVHKHFKNRNLLKVYEIPVYCTGLIKTYGPTYMVKGAFKINELKQYLEGYAERKENVIDTSIKGENRMDTFYLRLEKYNLWKPFSDETEYTNKKTLQFIENTLMKSKAKEKVIDDLIRQCILLLISIRDVLENYNVPEIYLLTDSQLNLHIRTIQSKKIKYRFYTLLKSVNMDFKKIGQSKKLRFSIENIDNPKDDSDKDDDEEFTLNDIYDFETYSDVFNYLINLDIHIPKTIEMIEKKGTVQYPSVWLYCILHLNNAWRNGDCDRFPELQIKDLLEKNQINDISWFKENRLTLPQAKSVIFRVRQWEMKMSKTQMKGVFFCSDELAPAFATAVIILSLYKYNNNILNNSDVDDEKNKLIMDFGNDYNEVRESMLKSFFRASGIEDFKFSSRKFNKTIMSYVYLLANLSGNAKALVFSQKLRGHIDEKSPLHYVNFDISKVEALGRQLFQRGEFGYIPTLLTSKVLGEGKTGTFEEMTNRVMEVNNALGGVQGIIDNTRALNIIRSERQLVVDMISEKNFKESQEILTDMFARNLSSKCGSDIQCLFGKDSCKMPHLDDEEFSCFDCPYHIPSIYALSSLCSSLVDNFKDYLGIPRYIKAKDCKEYIMNNQNSLTRMNRKTLFRIGLKIKRRRIILKEAIDKYGKDYVYECLGLEREDFIILSNLVKYDFGQLFPEIK